MMKLPSLSLYVHIPWCKKKCPYCDFYSKPMVKNKKIPQKKYIKNLLKDLNNDLKKINSRKINSIFIGGGTPSLLSSKILNIFIKKIKKKKILKNNLEITIEANPNYIESKNFNKYKKIGINRLSLGIQTFNSRILKILNRDYSKKKLSKSIKLAKKASFKSLNFDLMYNLPTQTFLEAMNDLKKAIKLKPNHISWYQFTIEPNTYFYKNRPNLPSDEISWKIYKKGKKFLKKNGFYQYEISSFSRKKYQCFHNLNYWKFGDYIGIGCGSHGKITTKKFKIFRTKKTKNIKNFLQGKYLKKKYKLPIKDIPLEFFINNFRLNKKIKKKNFTKFTNLNIKNISKEIKKAVKKKYIIEKKKFWKKTKKGKNFLNDLLEIFIKNKN
ncbi:radical SAM family heme chaperone HemW [Buchnera aphidicola]|uniref:radical SAM family heme chaperone HemW n=1 Tax=Buchnera aphidicola TaxID=9 RepID=UPI003463A731